MFKKIFYTLFILIFLSASCYSAIDVVYPTSKNSTINAPSTFLFGHTDKGAKFYINSEPVNLWEGNFFVHNVPLNVGVNQITFTSVLNGVTSNTVYTVTRKKTGSGTGSDGTYSAFSTPMYSKTTKNKSTVRLQPSTAGYRITELPAGVVLYLSGKKGDYYKIDESDGNEYWVHKSVITQPVTITQRYKAAVNKQLYFHDDKYEYYKFCLSQPVLYKIVQNNNSLTLTLFGTSDENNKESKNLVKTFNFDSPITGYDGYYEENNFVLRKAKNPAAENVNRPLEGIRIYIDAGHGGSEKGALGPTRVCEKDVNLSIANKLISLLQNDGAIVSYTRTDDRQMPLYERVKKAQDNNALISISIHSNSLPNGKNPFKQHGTEVHYYNENAKVLSQIINDNLAKDAGLLKNGIHKSSFALTRSTNPVSVLVEVAYMINPDEYILLKNDNFRQKVAESLEKSIKEYVFYIKK